MRLARLNFVGAVAVLGLILSACGSSPTSPSTGTGATLRGVAMGTAASPGGLRALSTAAAAASSAVTVTVQENPSITTRVSANGTFELEGLPAGTITLVFSRDGVTLGTITINGVPTQGEVQVVVQISTTSVVLVSVTINGADDNDNNSGNRGCLISGGTVGAGIELEGHVSSGTATAFKMDVNGERASALVDVNASLASFKCNGPRVSDTECRASVRSGAQVHVRGTLTSCSLSAAQVTAAEVMVQQGAN